MRPLSDLVYRAPDRTGFGPLDAPPAVNGPIQGRLVSTLVYCGHDAHRAIVKLSEAVQQTDGRYCCRRCLTTFDGHVTTITSNHVTQNTVTVTR